MSLCSSFSSFHRTSSSLYSASASPPVRILCCSALPLLQAFSRSFSRFSAPSRTAPELAPPVLFKPPKSSFNPLNPSSLLSPGQNEAEAGAGNESEREPFDPYKDLLNYWPDGFVPNLIKPLPWIVKPQSVTLSVPWRPGCVRCGALGTKVGMMSIWDARGVRYAVTVIAIDTQVIRINTTPSKLGLVGLVLGLGRANLKKVPKSAMVNAKKAGVYPKQVHHEFRVSPEALLPITHELSALHFIPGQHVDVTGISTGFGFTGPMQRWNFGGQPASHGVSLTHRSHGATGSRQDPGRVFKGKKMAGRMGGDQITQLNLRVFRIDPVRNLLFVTGAVPGHNGSVVRVRDAVKKPFERAPHYPTYTGEAITEMLTMPTESFDPFAYGSA